ncbi:NhaC Na:H antiporter (NhaC) family protein [Phytophthora cinnamomi]|uniref:NhaC Na:H antiporter (NhaC) family protein n=1 Tax=Phytophthora cinnamomi TaxID=4785 RepID=UPI00355ACBE1|nr:NhaC Na:H antiporter (NhaC) family protein [Phytophthora cinnamomi]
MTRQRRSLAYSAEYEFGDDNILTATFLEETRLRNRQRVKQAQSVLDLEAKREDRTVNNAKRIQQELDREIEISQHNQILLQRLERIHKKLPKQFDVSHHTEEHLNAQRPSNFPLWQREQERIAEENKKMKRRLDQTKSLFDTKKLAADAAKYRYFSEQLSKTDRRLQVKQKCKQLELQSNAKRNDTDCHDHSPPKPHHRHKRHNLSDVDHESEQCTLDGIHECHPDQQDSRGSRELPRVRVSHRVESKYTTSQESFPTVTSTSKLIRASDLLPRLGR